MMAEPQPQYASPDGVRAQAYGVHLPESSDDQLTALILKAERRLLARAKSIPQRVEDGRLAVEDVADVVTDMVLRVVRNPGGYSSEGAGEFNYRIDWAAASGRIQVTREDLTNLGIGQSGPAIGSYRSNVPSWRLP